MEQWWRWCLSRFHSWKDICVWSFWWYAVAEWYGARLAIARLRVWIPPVAAVYQCQLSEPSLRGRLMSCSLRATRWRPSSADWAVVSCLLCCAAVPLVCYLGQWMAAYRATVPLAHQSASTSKIVKRCCLRVFSCNQHYIKYPDLYLRRWITILLVQGDRSEVVGLLYLVGWREKRQWQGER